MTAFALAAPPRIDNPYWGLIKGWVGTDSLWGGPVLGGMHDWQALSRRFDVVGDYSWTVADPATVAFVADHVGPAAFDPLAGTGYWAYLLGQLGVEVLASDLMPPAPLSRNIYHKGTGAWVPVREADAVDACRRWGLGRTLLLSWPPYGEPVGEQVVAAFPGDRIVYIGEGDGGCCGDDGMWELLNSRWREVAVHWPVQWYGMHDRVAVFERVELPAIGGAR